MDWLSVGGSFPTKNKKEKKEKKDKKNKKDKSLARVPKE